MNLATHRFRLLLASIVIPFVVLRLVLHNAPDIDVNVGAYNIHHLYTGLLLITLGGIPLALFQGRGRLLDAAVICFGVGLSMALDEWIYLIVTDGSNASYLLPVSLWGGVAFIGLATLYTIVLWLKARSFGEDE